MRYAFRSLAHEAHNFNRQYIVRLENNTQSVIAVQFCRLAWRLNVALRRDVGRTVPGDLPLMLSVATIAQRKIFRSFEYPDRGAVRSRLAAVAITIFATLPEPFWSFRFFFVVQPVAIASLAPALYELTLTIHPWCMTIHALICISPLRSMPAGMIPVVIASQA